MYTEKKAICAGVAFHYNNIAFLAFLKKCVLLYRQNDEFIVVFNCVILKWMVLD